MKTLMLPAALLALGLACGALPRAAAAQQSLALSVCQDGPAISADDMEAGLAQLLAGSWSMSATGTGLTLGTNVMGVTLRADAGGQLYMEGGGGPSVALHLVTGAGEAPVDVSTEAMTPSGLTERDVQVLTACTTPTRYFWQFGSGTRRSWGALLFYGKDAATGYMANSAGGTRNVLLQR
ncbi:hypothetical protein [Pseudooceanicola marinus]|uniref:hypothetical protein n=1 Tax=Pseudooceanicola marinus TaxID=396013 RepID=UPI001CD5CEA9|nr:hypothetical protein [Pseudooceanicola marinus]MCA1335152.1 hypothetical protein [Pseudooceanicola marinus]